MTDTSASPNPVKTTSRSGERATGPADGHAHAAARKVHARESTSIPVPLVGRVELPPRGKLAFLGGIGVLAVAGVVEWPIALLLGLGHTLASQSKNRSLEELGQALDEA